MLRNVELLTDFIKGCAVLVLLIFIVAGLFNAVVWPGVYKLTCANDGYSGVVVKDWSFANYDQATGKRIYVGENCTWEKTK